MFAVEGKFKHKNGTKLKGTFKLTSKRKMRKEGKKWKPFKWEGTLNDKKIEIVQLCKKPKTIEDFQWDKFPEKLNVAKAYIADAIEEHEIEYKE